MPYERTWPTLDLGIVRDHSGAMQGPKLQAAKQPAAYQVDPLSAQDRVAVVVRPWVPAISDGADRVSLRLAFDAPEQQGRQKVMAMLRLPVVAGTQLDEFPPHEEA